MQAATIKPRHGYVQRPFLSVLYARNWYSRRVGCRKDKELGCHRHRSPTRPSSNRTNRFPVSGFPSRFTARRSVRRFGALPSRLYGQSPQAVPAIQQVLRVILPQLLGPSVLASRPSLDPLADLLVGFLHHPAVVPEMEVAIRGQYCCMASRGPLKPRRFRRRVAPPCGLGDHNPALVIGEKTQLDFLPVTVSCCGVASA